MSALEGGMSVPPHVWAELDRVRREGGREEEVDLLTSAARGIRCFYCLDLGVCYKDREGVFANLDGCGDYDIVTCPSCSAGSAEGGFVLCCEDPEAEVAGILKRGDRERMFWEGSPAEGTSVVAALARKLGIEPRAAGAPAAEGSSAPGAPSAEEAAGSGSGGAASRGAAESAAEGAADGEAEGGAARAAEEGEDAEEGDAPLVHPHITCDSCGAGPPLTGVVMTCADCWDFDLCWRCYPDRGGLGHPSDHTFQPRRPGGLVWELAIGWSAAGGGAAQAAADAEGEAAARSAEAAAAAAARAAEALARCARVPWSLCLRANVRGGLKGGGEMECALCLEEYKEGDSLLRLVCGHFFHEECIGPWFQKAPICPMCKQEA